MTSLSFLNAGAAKPDAGKLGGGLFAPAPFLFRRPSTANAGRGPAITHDPARALARGTA